AAGRPAEAAGQGPVPVRRTRPGHRGHPAAPLRPATGPAAGRAATPGRGRHAGPGNGRDRGTGGDPPRGRTAVPGAAGRPARPARAAPGAVDTRPRQRLAAGPRRARGLGLVMTTTTTVTLAQTLAVRDND